MIQVKTRYYLFVILILISCENANSPIMDNLVIEPDPDPVIISEFTSSNDSLIPENIRKSYHSDATYLAFLEMNETSDSNTVVINESLVDTIYKGLIHIYNCTTITSVDTIAMICPVHVSPDWCMDRIVLELDTTYNWTRNWLNGNTTTGNDTIDSLVTTYELIYQFTLLKNWVVLATDLNLNMFGLSYHFEQVPGVLIAEPDALGYWGGGYNNLGMTFDQNYRFYRYTTGSDLCMDCCSNRWVWRYKVSDEGEVTYLGGD